ncbi:hypothetical protein AQUSIP_10710 [Aquicella siphonis]|uniref:Uncharacterized protein n=1 Tax=Aquicella siphonis TaxID=254247 RepID=A0A5E4PHH3_9COXI|nr:hypothetical protein AQUSIP_10710 [Aquicella siphonis]
MLDRHSLRTEQSQRDVIYTNSMKLMSSKLTLFLVYFLLVILIKILFAIRTDLLSGLSSLTAVSVISNHDDR